MLYTHLLIAKSGSLFFGGGLALHSKSRQFICTINKGGLVSSSSFCLLLQNDGVLFGLFKNERPESALSRSFCLYTGKAAVNLPADNIVKPFENANKMKPPATSCGLPVPLFHYKLKGGFQSGEIDSKNVILKH